MVGAAFYGAIAFAAGAGVATFFAPCAFPLLPGYVGYYVQRVDEDVSALLSAGAVASGSLATLAAVTAVAFSLGEALATALPVLEPALGLALVAFGVLVLFGRAPSVSVELPGRPDSVAGFAVFGAVYALAAAGCVVPLFLGVVTQATALPTTQSVAVLAVYAGGVAVPLVGVTLLASAGMEAWRDAGRYTGLVERVAGVLLVVSGVAQIYVSLFVFEAP